MHSRFGCACCSGSRAACFGCWGRAPPSSGICSDALWAGLPVVTRKGTTFASRMAASLLQSLGLPDLIAHTAQEYEELAFRLATERELLDLIKQRLVRNRATSTLFDTAAFTRNLEAAFRTMAENGDRGAG